MSRDLSQYILDNYQKAIDYHYLRPYYQPVIRTVSRSLCSFEVLARWLDPEIGMIYPDEFIPVLEDAGKIHVLDEHIIRQACGRLRMRVSSGEVPIPVSVNLSRRDFELCDIFSVVDGIVSDYQLPHDYVCIEITESVVAENKEKMIREVDRFRSAGYQIWMDDFGSGYSSLNILKEYHFDELKLDMEFLRPFSVRSQRIATSVIEMAKSIYTHTLAEGVETEDQFMYLRNVGCEKVQGYYFGKPLPYEEALQHLADIGVGIERPQERKYYDDIGMVDFLSAVPFMTREERESITTARQLNSIPLAIIEMRRDSFRILFHNTAFEEIAEDAGLIMSLFRQDQLGKAHPFNLVPERIINLLDSTRKGGDGRMQFTYREEYYEVRAKCIAKTRGRFSVLMRISNLSKAARSSTTGKLDDSLRRIYAMYERITLVDLNEDTITPLYVATREELVSERVGARSMAAEYAKNYLHPEDRQIYLDMVDPETVEERFIESGTTYMTRILRTRTGHGDYVWKEYTDLRLEKNVYLILIRRTHVSVLNLESRIRLKTDERNSYPPEELWRNLVHSDIINLFWKDKDRRFLGASRAFLDYYGFESVDEIIGKNDEDLGWHIHPDQFKNDELGVINEGAAVHNMPGHCLCKGENRDILASKAPLYDLNGKIEGLVGYFIDRDLLTANDARGGDTKRRDIHTGLLNSRGISEEAVRFRDEYFLRKRDFVRMHIIIDDLGRINDQYGHDFGDKMIFAFGDVLKKEFGHNCVVGRTAGARFVIMKQIDKDEDARLLREQVRKAGSSISEIDGIPTTFYISIGFALFSESENLSEQEMRSERRILADQNLSMAGELMMSRAAELFRLFDDLPVVYAVYHITRNEERGAADAVIFYVNHKYEHDVGITSAETVGRGVRELYPFMDQDKTWYDDLIAAALRNEKTEGTLTFRLNGVTYKYTAQQVIYEGYCAVTYQEI